MDALIRIRIRIKILENVIINSLADSISPNYVSISRSQHTTKYVLNALG